MTRQVTMSEDRSFIFDGGRTGALLLHGLGGTPVEMRFVALALARAGMTVLCPQLAAHTGSFDELQESRWQDWYASAEAALDQLRRRCDTVIVAGLSMGAVLALMLAAERKKDVDGAVLYAPTLTLDGWGVPWYARLFKLVQQKSLAKWFNFAERAPYGVKDPRVRARVTAAIESGDSSTAGMLKVPGGAMFELGGLVSAVRERARGIRQPVLLVHPRHDDRASIHNSFWLQRNLAGTVDMVVLDGSYHVVTVDRQRHVVTDRTIAFAKTIEGAKDKRGCTVVEMPMGAGRRQLSAA
ncbi:MAG: alpha/beta fold hydrolase [Hyphomicrobium sp.]